LIAIAASMPAASHAEETARQRLPGLLWRCSWRTTKGFSPDAAGGEIQFTPNSKAQRDALADGSIEIAQSAVDNAVAMAD
jgi:hypothetical protein